MRVKWGEMGFKWGCLDGLIAILSVFFWVNGFTDMNR